MKRCSFRLRVVLLLVAFMVNDSVTGFSPSVPHVRPVYANKKLLSPPCPDLSRSSSSIHRHETRSTCLFAEHDAEPVGSDSSPSESDVSKADDAPSREGPSTARVGGRTPNKRLTTDNGESGMRGFLAKWGSVVVPAMAVLFLLKAILGWLFTGPAESNYVYYQSSVYESRSLTPEGRVETSRKESMRSNIPSLINAQKEQNNGRSSYLLKEVPDEEFEQELESMMRFQRSMLNDFFQ